MSVIPSSDQSLVKAVRCRDRKCWSSSFCDRVISESVRSKEMSVDGAVFSDVETE